MKQKLEYKRLEHAVRGIANHRRIQVLELLEREPDLDVMTLASRFGVHFKTMSVHTRRLFLAGHVTKKNAGASVVHRLTTRGEEALTYLRSIE